MRGNWDSIDMIKEGAACLIVETRGCHSSEKTGTTSGDGSIEKKQTPRQQSINITLQCTFKNETWHGTDMIYVQFATSLIEVDLNKKFKFKLQMWFKLAKVAFANVWIWY